jgi:flavoprotein
MSSGVAAAKNNRASSSTHVEVYAYPVQVQTQSVQATVENSRVGVCRRCRREFVRPIGVNDGQAQYYRCSECDAVRFDEMILASCSLS